MGTTVSSTNKTNYHDIADILLKMELKTITLNLYDSISEHTPVYSPSKIPF